MRDPAVYVNEAGVACIGYAPKPRPPAAPTLLPISAMLVSDGRSLRARAGAPLYLAVHEAALTVGYEEEDVRDVESAKGIFTAARLRGAQLSIVVWDVPGTPGSDTSLKIDVELEKEHKAVLFTIDTSEVAGFAPFAIERLKVALRRWSRQMHFKAIVPDYPSVAIPDPSKLRERATRSKAALAPPALTPPALTPPALTPPALSTPAVTVTKTPPPIASTSTAPAPPLVLGTGRPLRSEHRERVTYDFDDDNDNGDLEVPLPKRIRKPTPKAVEMGQYLQVHPRKSAPAELPSAALCDAPPYERETSVPHILDKFDQLKVELSYGREAPLANGSGPTSKKAKKRAPPKRRSLASPIAAPFSSLSLPVPAQRSSARGKGVIRASSVAPNNYAGVMLQPTAAQSATPDHNDNVEEGIDELSVAQLSTLETELAREIQEMLAALESKELRHLRVKQQKRRAEQAERLQAAA